MTRLLCRPEATGAKLSGRIICLCCRAFTVKSGSIAYPNLCALRFVIMPFDSLEYFQLPAVNKSGFAADVSFFPERATGAKLSGRIICLCCRAFTVKSGSIAYPNLCALRFVIMPFDSLEYFQLPAVNKSGFAADVSFFPERGLFATEEVNSSSHFCIICTLSIPSSPSSQSFGKLCAGYFVHKNTVRDSIETFTEIQKGYISQLPLIKTILLIEKETENRCPRLQTLAPCLTLVLPLDLDLHLDRFWDLAQDQGRLLAPCTA
ncbi:hypothetical protein HGM15179_010628 [Zosterops borbonicus]|uniref:Uncharacterized protein n=1 Tax=Zosterops borbonicus TaxID=364589 RepID=A0A8K1GEW9_9PASS|nr:hypothetical protein HGM15179_010628 [Zosterops borbonicus]